MKKFKLNQDVKFKFFLIYNNIIFLWLININKLNHLYNKKNSLITGIESAKKANKFIYNCYKGILLRTIPTKKINNPKISAVIPIYNRQNKIKKAILSVQNQDLSELEIILVNDFSSDNTSDIIKELKKNDSRIKILNNKKNMGTLYSRCLGSLYANGKYIYPLDSDDMVLDRDVFNILYKEGKNDIIDIILFKSILVNSLNDFLLKKNISVHREHYSKDFFLFQPQLGEYGTKSGIVCGKSIKSKIYKKAINAYGIKRYSQYMTSYEDSIINYIIHQYAKSSKFILKHCLLIFRSPITIDKLKTKKDRVIYYLKFLEVLFEFSKNTSNAKLFAISKINNLMNINKFNKLLLNEKFKKNFILLVKRILSSKYVSENNKYLIRQKCLRLGLII